MTKSRADHHMVGAGLRRKQRSPATRGLTTSHNRTPEYVFESAALTASRREPFKSRHGELLERGLRPELARATVARRIAAITLAVWEAGGAFDAGKVIGHAA